MSGLYVTYPAGGSGTTSVGSYANLAAFPNPPPTGMYLAVAQDTDTLYVYDDNTSTWLAVGGTAVPLAVGPLDGASKKAAGATIGSNSVYMQTADATSPGLVSSAAQSFAGTKTFTTPPQFSSLTSNFPAVLGSGSILNSRSLLFGSPDVIGSVSLTTQVSGILPVANGGSTGSNTGDLSIAAFGSSPNASGGTIAAGQVLTLQPANGTNPGGVTAVAQTFGGAKTFTSAPQFSSLTSNLPTVLGSGSFLSSRSLLFGSPDVIGSVSLVNQVAGNLSLSQTSGSISLTNQVVGILPQGNIPTTLNIGSVTMTSSTGGAAYTVRWPGAQGTLNQAPLNDGAGNLAWGAVLTNPMTTSGDIIVGSASGVAARLAINTSNSTSFLVSSGGGTATAGWQPFSAPTVTRFTTIGGPSTYNPPSGVKYLRVRLIGGGGSGGSSIADGVNGSSTSFASLVGGGGPGKASGGGPTAGGTASGGNVANFPGGCPGSGTNNAIGAGGNGGSGPFGGSGAGGNTGGTTGTAGAANTGAGGGGSSVSASAGGGGAGGYVEHLFTSASSSYTYTVGAGGPPPSNAGAGGSGIIIVEEYYI